MKLSIVFCTLFLVCCLSIEHVMAYTYRLNILNYTYTVNTKYTKIQQNQTYTLTSKYGQVEYSLIDGNRLNAVVNLYGTITKAIVSGEVIVKRNNMHSSIKKSYDICKFLENPKSEPLLSALMTDLKKDTRHKVTYKCPVEPGEYFVRDLVLQFNFPIFMPSVNATARGTGSVTVNNETITGAGQVTGMLFNLSPKKTG